MQGHLQRKQDVCMVIHELSDTDKEELDQMQREKAVHKESHHSRISYSPAALKRTYELLHWYAGNAKDQHAYDSIC